MGILGAAPRIGILRDNQSVADGVASAASLGFDAVLAHMPERASTEAGRIGGGNGPVVLLDLAVDQFPASVTEQDDVAALFTAPPTPRPSRTGWRRVSRP